MNTIVSPNDPQQHARGEQIDVPFVDICSNLRGFGFVSGAQACVNTSNIRIKPCEAAAYRSYMPTPCALGTPKAVYIYYDGYATSLPSSSYVSWSKYTMAGLSITLKAHLQGALTSFSYLRNGLARQNSNMTGVGKGDNCRQFQLSAGALGGVRGRGGGERRRVFPS